MPEPERRRDRWVSAALSVLMHGALIAALVYGWLVFRHQTKPEPTLAINATVVGPEALNGGQGKKSAPRPAPLAAPPVPAPVLPTEDEQTVPPPKPPDTTSQPPPMTTPPPPAQSSSQSVSSQASSESAAAAQRQADEEARAAKEAAERKAKQAAEAKARAEAKRVAEAKRKADEERKAEEQRRAQEAKALALNQTDLQESVADEERLLEARSGPAMASWKQLIEARIHQAWIQPPTVRSGLDCTLTVTQVPGGQIVNVKLDSCNGDSAVQQSIEDAAYRASPLPAPPDPSLFVRELTIHFTHSDNSP
ncbi:MAG TPA: cell envelope integrity protein TolA [Steroidobacteraceae bacterium]|nr:cell envelope integrity protein TolA [Steroidobacteraceae bacterium]